MISAAAEEQRRQQRQQKRQCSQQDAEQFQKHVHQILSGLNVAPIIAQNLRADAVYAVTDSVTNVTSGMTDSTFRTVRLYDIIIT